MALVWSKITTDDGSAISLMTPEGETLSIPDTHAGYRAILKELAVEEEGYEERVMELADARKTVVNAYTTLSERVRVADNQLFFDGDPLAGTLSTHIIDHLAGSDETHYSLERLVKFLEKVAQNPSAESRESLYDFVKNHGLTITNEGNFIGYKGVNEDFGSVRKGPGIVNGVDVNGSLDNSPGNLLEMARSQVDANRNNGCSTGLHVSNYSYASGWGRRVVAVSVNPRDVVSVPRDSEFSKIRVSRYSVLVEISKKEQEGVGAVWAKAEDPNSEVAEANSKRDAIAAQVEATDVGSKVRLTYWGGSEEHYDLTVESKSATHVGGPTQVGYRSFIIRHLQSWDKVPTAAAAQESTAVEKLEGALEAATALTVGYMGAQGHVKTYHVLVKELTEAHVLTVDSEGQHRLLKLERITSVG